MGGGWGLVFGWATASTEVGIGREAGRVGWLLNAKARKLNNSIRTTVECNEWESVANARERALEACVCLSQWQRLCK